MFVPSRLRPLFGGFVLLVAGLACIAFVLFHRTTVGFHPTFINSDRPCDLLLCFDRSESYRPYLGIALAQASELAERLNPEHDRLRCLAVDTQATELYDNLPPESNEMLENLLARHLEHIPARRGTFPDRLWSSVSEKCAGTERPTAVAFYTDGDNDDPAAQATLTRMVADLARNPHIVFVGIYGVTPENRQALTSIFAPFGYDRFRLYDAWETDNDLLFSRLKEAPVSGKEIRKQ